MMSDIYKSAEVVMVWLACACEQAVSAFHAETGTNPRTLSTLNGGNKRKSRRTNIEPGFGWRRNSFLQKNYLH